MPRSVQLFVTYTKLYTENIVNFFLIFPKRVIQVLMSVATEISTKME
jgi:hypothetical protein